LFYNWKLLLKILCGIVTIEIERGVEETKVEESRLLVRGGCMLPLLEGFHDIARLQIL